MNMRRRSSTISPSPTSTPSTRTGRSPRSSIIISSPTAGAGSPAGAMTASSRSSSAIRCAPVPPIRSFDAQLRLNGRFETGFLSHTVFLGLEHWDYLSSATPTTSRAMRRRRSISSCPSIRRASDYAGAFWSNGVARAISRSVYGQDLIDLNENWRILLGGRYDLLAQRERVFDPFGALAGEPTASLSKGITGLFQSRAPASSIGRTTRRSSSPPMASRSSPTPACASKAARRRRRSRTRNMRSASRRELSRRKMSFEVGLFDITRDNVAIPNPANPSRLLFARHRPAAQPRDRGQSRRRDPAQPQDQRRRDLPARARLEGRQYPLAAGQRSPRRAAARL